MAAPVPLTYTSPVQRVGGGRDVFPHASLDLLAAAPENSWVQLSSNAFADAWPPADLRTGIASPNTIIYAWGSIAWDAKRHGFWMWGGGHANWDDNDVYFWSAVTRQWSLAYLSSRYATNKMIDNPYSPVSSHTYGNNIFLPTMDRMLTFGGAGQNDGMGLRVYSDGVSLRGVGCYTLQPELAGKMMVGSLPGMNYKKGAYVGKDLPGARAWELRDWYLDNPTVAGGAFPAKGHANCGACTRIEGGRDVVYFSYSISTSRAVGRVEFVDHDYRNDIVSPVATQWNDAGGSIGPIDIIPNKDVMLELHTNANATKAQFIDLLRPRPTSWQRISTFYGPDVAEFLSELDKGQGVLADRKRDCFVMWRKGANVWRIDPPARGVDGFIPLDGWTVTKLTAVTAGAPVDPGNPASNGGGVTGKWRYAPDLDCYIGMVGSGASPLGVVYAYKPGNWQDPRIA